jgi:hypothetical protein
MRLVYAHFPINCTTVNNNTELEIRNFLGEKIVRKVAMLPGVTVERSEKIKDELVLTGNDVEAVSQSGMHGLTAIFVETYETFSRLSSPFLLGQEEGYSKVLGRYLC